MKKVREIIRINQQGDFSIRQIARMCGISRPTVQGYLMAFQVSGRSWTELAGLPDNELHDILFAKIDQQENKRLDHLTEQFPNIKKELSGLGVTLFLLWEEYQRNTKGGYGYSQFCHHYHQWARKNNVWMRQEHVAGDKMFVDFTGATRTYYDGVSGETKEAQIFVAILGASRYMYIEATASQKQEDFARACRNALHFFGGVPRAIVPDNLKSAVSKACRYEPGINALYDQFAGWYDLAIMPTRPREARDKALVEGGVLIGYRRVLAAIRNETFFSLVALNEGIQRKTKMVNDRAMKQYGQSRRQLFEELDQPALRPLPPQPFPDRCWQPADIGFDYHVFLKEDKHWYSAPYEYHNKKADLFYSEGLVEIYCQNRRIAVHIRDRRSKGKTTKAEHMPSHHRFVAEWTPERIANWAAKVGPQVREFVIRLMEAKKHPEQGFKSAIGVISLEKKYGAERVNLACGRALACVSYHYHSVKHILERGLERQTITPQTFDALSAHENVRGEKYYEEAHV